MSNNIFNICIFEVYHFLLPFAPLIAVFSQVVAAARPSPVLAFVAIRVRLTRWQNRSSLHISWAFHHLLNCWTWSRPSLCHITSDKRDPSRSCLLARKSMGTPVRCGSSQRESSSFLITSILASFLQKIPWSMINSYLVPDLAINNKDDCSCVLKVMPP